MPFGGRGEVSMKLDICPSSGKVQVASGISLKAQCFLNPGKGFKTMKINFFLSAVLGILTLYACGTDNRESSTETDAGEAVNTEQETPVKMIEQLVGEWQLDGSQGGNSPQANNGTQRLVFTEEARYIAYSGNQKVDSGAFRMNEQLRNLYLESEANEQPREYEVELQQDVMTLKARQTTQGGQAAQSFTYRRIGQGSISPQKRGEQ